MSGARCPMVLSVETEIQFIPPFHLFYRIHALQRR